MEPTAPKPSRSLVAYFAALPVVALAAAAFALGFRWSLLRVFSFATGTTGVVSNIAALPWWGRLLLPALGGLLAGGLAAVLARGRRSQGVGDVMEAVVFGRVRLSMRTTLLKSAGSWLAIASGGSLGREGPVIQFGGTFGGAVARWFRVDEEHARTLVAAGTAAGFAAAYNTPLAAVLFVLEVVTGVVALDAVVGTLVATAIATALTWAAEGPGPLYGERVFTVSGLAEAPAWLVLGIVAALVAQGFMRLLSAGESMFERSGLPQPWRAGVGGLLVGAVLVWSPEVAGNGFEPLEAMLDGTFALGLVAWLAVAKAFATTASVSSGSPGGVFTPNMLLGAAAGLGVHHLLALVLPSDLLGSAGAYALLGLAATTAASTHAPLMSAVLALELSRDYVLVVPLLLANAAATFLSRHLRADSIYGAELRKRGLAWEVTLEGRRMVREAATDEAGTTPDQRA